MSFWTAVVVIVSIWGFVQIYTHRHDHRRWKRHERDDDQPIAAPQPDPEARREIEELRERVKVLERIATEDRETKLLSAEIESLRKK